MDRDNERRGGLSDCAYFTGPSILKQSEQTPTASGSGGGMIMLNKCLKPRAVANI
jgi:hypothetical protein